MKMFAICAALSAGIWMSSAAAAAEAVKWEPYTLISADGAKAEGELGTLMVPENRANPKSRQIPLGPVDESKLSDEVRHLKGWSRDAYDLTTLGPARAECLEWLREEFLE